MMRSQPNYFDVVLLWFLYWVQLWSIKVQLTPPWTTVAVAVVLDIVADVVVVVADVVVFVKVIVLALLVVTDPILFTCGQ